MTLCRAYIGVIGAVLPHFAHADISCPDMPAAITTVARDVQADLNVQVGSLGKLKAGELTAKTDVVAKSVFDKYPNVDRVIALQTMSATYCTMLRDAPLSPEEKLDRWNKFQFAVLDLRIERNAQAKNAKGAPPGKKVTIKETKEQLPVKPGSSDADVNHGRQRSLRDFLLSVYERHPDPRRPELDNQLVQLFDTVHLDRLVQKRILWVNAHPSEEDLDLANAFTALGVQIFHARSNCSAKRLMSEDKYSLIVTNMWRPKDDSDIANCARNIDLPPENAPPDIKYPGGFQFLEYMLHNNPNGTPVLVYSSWKPADVSQEMTKWHLAQISTEPVDTYSFVLRTLSNE